MSEHGSLTYPPVTHNNSGLSFYEPTILAYVHANMRLAQEEIFGPVAAIFPFETEEEVIDAANTCNVGLASYIFTQDFNRATRVSELIQSGMVAINTGAVSDSAVPYATFYYNSRILVC